MLSSEVLISPILSLDALLIAGSDKTFNVYIHRSAGSVDVASGTEFPQVINALTPTATLLSHATQQFQKISQQADVRFVEVFSQSDADIAFFFDSEINLNDPDPTAVTLGLAVTNRDNGKRWIEIFLNGPKLKNSSIDLEAYVFNHELLHALGLEHTFDDSDGDFYLSTNPQLSATPEETVMSYRTPASGVYPTDLTISDYKALQSIWDVAVEDPIQAPQTVYRLYQLSTGRHFYSSNQQEIDSLTGQPKSDYLNEGIAYTVAGDANQDLHRFYKPSTGLHFYSASDRERDSLIAVSDSGYLYEGVAYQVFDAHVAPSGSTPVFRFYDPSQGSHFYTANNEERLILQSTQPNWIPEGIAWYV